MRNRPEDNNREHDERRRRHEQNTSNRWGEPDPRMGPGSFKGHHRDQDYNRHDDWRPFEQPENRHFEQEDRRYNHYREERNARPHNRHFNHGNQHANDRWSDDRDMPSQRHHPRHASERFYREQRRRND